MGHVTKKPTFFFAHITFFFNENTILKVWEMVGRLINYVYLLHLGKNFEKNFPEEIKYGQFLLPVAFLHEMRYHLKLEEIE